jgi:hypothetical protein
MPIPTPKSSETKSAFVKRCITQISGEYKPDQSVAICISAWDNEKFKSYPWNKCIQDQIDRGYGVKTAERICGWIKKKNK